MKTKILLGVVVALVIGLAAGAFWWLRRPQVITFSDDSKVTLLAVQYGKRHAPPTVKVPAASITAKTPVRRGPGSFTTTNNTLVLWVRQEYDSGQNQYHNFQYCVYDKAETACVQTFGRNYGNGRQGNEIVAVQIDAFPRRQGRFVVRVQENGNGGQEMSDQKFVIANPVRGSFPKWTAEPLPATQVDDDLSVTLTKLVAGADAPINRDQNNPDDAINKGVQAVLHVERNGKPVANWEPVSVETSDATGNESKTIQIGQNGWQNGWANNSWQNGDDTFIYQWGLWPDEPAWKIKFEFSQQSDFSSDEQWTVQNIPLQPGRQQDFYNYGGRNNTTNAAFAETDLNGVHLKVFPAKQFNDQNFGNGQLNGGFQIQVTPQIPTGMRLTLTKVTDDQGQDIQNYNSGTMSGNGKSVTYGYQLQNIGGVTNLNLTLAVHKSRFVEFTATPETEKP
jgi:hypothetical protein